ARLTTLRRPSALKKSIARRPDTPRALQRVRRGGRTYPQNRVSLASAPAADSCCARSLRRRELGEAEVGRLAVRVLEAASLELHAHDCSELVLDCLTLLEDLVLQGPDHLVHAGLDLQEFVQAILLTLGPFREPLQRLDLVAQTVE